RREERERAFAAGMDAFLAKPYAAGDLYGVVETLGAAGRERRRAGRTGIEMVVDVEEAMDRFAGERHLLDRLLLEFAERAPARVAELWDTIAAGDAAVVQRIAHGLRGSAATLGLYR